jgi:anti-anti-sigma factor
MALLAQESANGKQLTLKIDGRFDFNLHKEFRRAYEQARQPGIQYIVDMSRTEYLDSSALGMLLLLREHAGGDRADVQIVQCNPAIRKILATANFHQLFTIV